MTTLEQGAMKLIDAVKKSDEHHGCWFCERGTGKGHHHFGDGCSLPDAPASPSWVEKAS